MLVLINLYALKICNPKDRSKHSKWFGRNFRSSFLDTGAPQRVIGRPQKHAKSKHPHLKFNLKPSHRCFEIGMGTYPLLRSILTRIQTPNSSPLKIEMDFEADVPMLLGLDIMDRERLVPNNVLNELQASYHGFLLYVVRKYGYFYLELSSK